MQGRWQRMVAGAAVLFGAAHAALADVSADIQKFTGAPTRLVWVRDHGDNKDVFGKGDKLALMGLDSADGKGERAILGPDKLGNFHKPMLTPDGTRIVYTDLSNDRVRIVNFDGTNLREVIRGHATAVWQDPKTGRTYIYFGEPVKEDKLKSLKRIDVDRADPPQTVWDRSEVSTGSVQLSADGTHASALVPWPNVGRIGLPNGTLDRFGGGCWTSMAPDNTYRVWHFDGPHRNVYIFDPGDKKGRKVGIGDAPGINGFEVYHPRWSHDVRFLTVSGPYLGRGGKPGGNRIGDGGKAVELYLGRFDENASKVEAWVQVTRNDRADFFGDAWIKPGKRPLIAQVEKPRPVTPPAGLAWPGKHEGLVFVWANQAAANRVQDAAAKVDRLCQVTLRGEAVFTRHHGLDLGGGYAEIDDLDDDLLQACRKSNAITIIATLTPGNVTQSGPARIITFSRDTGLRNFTLGQEKDELVLRLRTTRTTPNGTEPQTTLARLEAGKTLHVAITYTPGNLVAYVDGRQVGRFSKVAGDFSTWDAMTLRLGDEITGDREWRGQLEQVALYSRALGEEELAVEYALAKKDLAGRAPVDGVTVDAKLITTSELPTVASLGAYQRSLVVHTWQVEKVVNGKLQGNKVAVAHWAILDRKLLPRARALKVGDKRRLTLEAFDDHPQLKGELRQDGEADPALPLYVDMER